MMIMNIVWSTCRQRKAPSKNLCLSYTRKKRFGISLNRICFSEICKASYGQNRHNRWWCTFFKPVDFFPQRTQKGFEQGLSREHLANPHIIWWKYQIHHSKYRMLRLMWSIFVANLHPFWPTFHTLKNAVLYQKWTISILYKDSSSHLFQILLVNWASEDSTTGWADS